MKQKDLNKKFVHATKWSAITEIAAKIVIPVTNMILARIISPEAFGVIATVTMIVTFSEMFADAGFQKYLVQFEFKSESEKHKSANVAFWTNLFIAIVLWLFIIVFSEKIALLVGNPGMGNVISVACFQLLLTAFSSIQMALYRRDFDFKTLFVVRVVAIAIPFFVTIPLALLGLSYWALVIGTIIIQLSNAIILTIKSKWKPFLYYRFETLKKMLSFSIWSLIESISIWLTAWIDVFIISSALNQYYLGIYKTSTILVNAFMSLIVASVVPVLFSALSRLQFDDEKFKKLYFRVQKLVALLIFPFGILIYFQSDLATKIMLGDKWSDASDVIGVWGLTSAIMVVFAHFCSEVYRAKGKPKLSFIAQVLHLVVLVPVCIYSSKFGFWALVFSRAWIRMQLVIVHLFIMRYAIGISLSKTLLNVMPLLIASAIMVLICILLGYFSEKIIWNIVSIIVSILSYLIVICLFKDIRNEIITFINKFVPKRYLDKLNFLNIKLDSRK